MISKAQSATGQTRTQPYYYIYLNSFAGGINKKDNPLVLRDDECQDIINMIVSTQAVEKRPGYIRDTTITVAGVSGLENLYRFYATTGDSHTMSSALALPNRKVLYGNTELTGGTALDPIMVQFIDYRGWLFMFNGIQFECWNGTGTKSDVVFDGTGSYLADLNPRIMEVCDDRLFAVDPANPNRLYYSDYGGWNTTPLADMRFDSINYIEIKGQTSDKNGIIALKAYSNNDELLVCRENDSWLLLGVGTSDYSLHKVSGVAGCVSPRGIAEQSDGTLVIMGNQEVYLMAGSNLYPIGEKVTPLFTNYNMNSCCAVYDPIRDLVLMSYPDGTLVWNNSVKNWTRWDLSFAGACCCKATNDSSRMLMSKATALYIYQIGGNSDDTANISWKIRTKAFDLGYFGEKKFFRSLKSLQTTPVKTPFTAKISINDGDLTDSHVMTLPSAGVTWGSSNWAAFNWSGTKKLVGAVIFREGLIGNTFDVEISNSDDDGFILYKLAVEMYTEERRREETVT